MWRKVAVDIEIWHKTARLLRTHHEPPENIPEDLLKGQIHIHYVAYVINSTFLFNDTSSFVTFKCVVDTEDKPGREYQRTVNVTCAVPCDVTPTIASPLHVAVKRGRHETVAVLLEANANVNAADSDGRRPLQLAVKNADCRVARMLLGRGARADVPDSHGKVPLQIAAKYGHVELVRMLIEHDASVFHEGQTGPTSPPWKVTCLSSICS